MKKRNEEIELIDDETSKPMLHENHKLKTRRDFLAQGLIAGTGTVLAPSILGMISAEASASVLQCPTSALNPTKIPVAIFDLAGGISFAGSNIMVGGQGGQLDFLPEAAYRSLGLPPSHNPSLPGQIDNELGLAFHSDSQVLAGIKSVTSPSTRANCDGVVFCATSADDTSNNQFNPLYWLHRAGAIGTLRHLIGNGNNPSGGNSLVPAASLNPMVYPAQIGAPQNIANLVSPGTLASFFNSQSTSKVEKVLRSIGSISQNHLDKISTREIPNQIKNLIKCAFEKAPDQINQFEAAVLNPLLDQTWTSNFNNNDAVERRVGSVIHAVVSRLAGAGTISIGGYDYHDGSRATGEIRDFNLGRYIGKSLEYAAQKNQDLMLILFSDGSVGTNQQVDNSQNGRGKYIWTGDSGVRGAAWIIVYKKDGKPSLRTNGRRQIGHYRPNGANENSAMLTSNSVVNLSKAFVANYLALNGEESKLSQVVGDNPFGGNLDQYIGFNKIR